MAFNIHFNSAIHFSVFNKIYTNQMIVVISHVFSSNSRRKKKGYSNISHIQIQEKKKEKKERKISVLFFIDHSILVVFVYFFFLRSALDQKSALGPIFPDITSQLHTLGLVASNKINKIYLAAALLMSEFLRVHDQVLLNSISVIASQS